MTYKYLIIGGGVAGVTCAETIRATDAEGTIGIVSDEPYMLYSRVMLSKPNFFLEKVPFDQIWLKGKQWYEDKKISFIGGHSVNGIDPQNKNISISNGEKINYEKLLIAIGTATRKCTVKGSDKKGIHYLKTLEDAKGIMEDIKNAKSAVTVGGGFIGFEMADLMQMAKMKTTVVVREPCFWHPTLDQESGQIIENAMKNTGLDIIHSNEVAEILGDERVSGVILKDGRQIPCEIIVFGIGTANDFSWIQSAGIQTNKGILANEYMETNIPDIWVAGDVAEYKDLLLEENIQMGNWVSAHEQGRIVGQAMVGKREPFKFISFYTTTGFGLSIAFVGDVNFHPERQIIARKELSKNSIGRIILDKNQIAGATLINRTQEMGAISKLIEKNVDVSGVLDKLGDIEFDLKGLLKS